MATSAHVSKVRSLYKRILVLHRFLPIDLKALGDQYVKDEFRRHKNAANEEVKSFMKEWEVKPALFSSPCHKIRLYYSHISTTLKVGLKMS